MTELNRIFNELDAEIDRLTAIAKFNDDIPYATEIAISNLKSGRKQAYMLARAIEEIESLEITL